MDVSRLGGAVRPASLQPDTLSKDKTPSSGFSDMLKSYFSDTNQVQKNAGEKVQSLISGETSNVHEVMVAIEKASVSFEMMMEMRNKVVDAYRELMRANT